MLSGLENVVSEHKFHEISTECHYSVESTTDEGNSARLMKYRVFHHLASRFLFPRKAVKRYSLVAWMAMPAMAPHRGITGCC